MRATKLTPIVVVLAGCSLLNAPDEGKLDGGMMDGGMMDGGDGGDGGMDAEVIDGCVVRPEVCTNAMDDDCDGLVDCADFDCTERVECCEDGTSMPLRWVAPLSDRWTATATNFPTVMGMSGSSRLDGFVGEPGGIISRDCLPLANGRSFSIPFEISGACPSCYATFALTIANGARPGELVRDELSVVVRGDGRIATSIDRTERATTEPGFLGAGQRATVRFDVVPGTDTFGRASLLGTVVVTNAATEASETLEAGYPFVLQEQLSSGEGCGETPGLRVAIQGEGSAVKVYEIGDTQLQCVNPSQFLQIPDACPLNASPILTANGGLSGGDETRSLGATWAESVAAPFLLGTGPMEWDVYFDGTQGERSLEDATWVGFGVGKASTMTWCQDAEWSPRPNAVTPIVSPCDLSCLADQDCMCTGARSARDPSVVARGAFRVLAYSVKQVGRSDTYGIDVLTENPTNPASAAPLLAEDSGCISLRDPMIVGAGPSDTDGYWLFYTCQRETLPEREIRAVRLDEDRARMGASFTVLAPESPAVGEWGASAIYAPEVLVEYDPMGTNHVFRLWALALGDPPNKPSVVLFQGQQREPDTLPSFQSFGANPILDASHSLLAGCPGCSISGLSVARVTVASGSSPRIRFLLARTLDRGTGYELVPAEQFWVSPFR